MDMLRQLNQAMEYIEEQLAGDIHPGEAARIACVSEDSFLRFFSYMTGMTLRDYVRRRRLTLAAEELRKGDLRVIDLAVKYGYDSADAFSRAFYRQHGMMPAEYRRRGGELSVYPPASFHITIRGAREMKQNWIDLEDTEVVGLSMPFDGQGYPTHETLRNLMWADYHMDVPAKLCEGTWNQPGSTAYDGVWYGIWQNGRYMIARAPGDVRPDTGELETVTLPAGRYVSFRSECGAVAWEVFPQLREDLFSAWLPSSGYRQKGDLVIEVEHLYTDHDERQKKRWFEVWVPVE